MFYDLYKCTDLLLIIYYIRPGQVFWQGGGEVLSGHASARESIRYHHGTHRACVIDPTPPPPPAAAPHRSIYSKRHSTDPDRFVIL